MTRWLHWQAVRLFKIADIIATAVWEKTLAKQKMSMFAPTKGELTDIYEESERAAIKVRLNRGRKDDEIKSTITKIVQSFYSGGLNVAAVPSVVP